jgi:hypothetical protein
MTIRIAPELTKTIGAETPQRIIVQDRAGVRSTCNDRFGFAIVGKGNGLKIVHSSPERPHTRH